LSTLHPIKSDVIAGSVYYYNDPGLKSTYPHYCIVVNINPSKDTVLLLVHASHRISKVKERRKGYPQETLVEIDPTEYPGFDKQSIIDCNDVMERDVEVLRRLLAQRKLVKKPVMGLRLVRRVRKGIIASDQVAQTTKDLLDE